jgi:hypothetical protein
MVVCRQVPGGAILPVVLQLGRRNQQPEVHQLKEVCRGETLPNFEISDPRTALQSLRNYVLFPPRLCK